MAYEDELGYQVFRAPVSEFLCRDWNARQSAEKQIGEFDLNFCTESQSAAIGLSSLPPIVRERLVHFDFSDGPKR